ncbi:hypothetical protein QA943_24215 [Streptomyces sp. B21-097]|uniref:hypothetical protein n=1 Tax=Streptomyces sp. B21-097 TaxID=3039414 RepID=UPI002FEF69B0
MTKRKLVPSVWYCKYCYKRRPIDYGSDGSVIICTVCGSGLAPTEDVFAAGSMLTWWEQICEEFEQKLAAGRARADAHTPTTEQPET